MKTEYIVANATASDENELMSYERAIAELEQTIDSFLERGWQLQGGVSISAVAYEIDTKDTHKYGRQRMGDCGGTGVFTRVMACQAMTRIVNGD